MDKFDVFCYADMIFSNYHVFSEPNSFVVGSKRLTL